MTKLVSIIVPVYNSSAFLDKCIQSVINQTYHNIELILVNDGSTDNSGDICNQYAKSDSRIKIIHKKNGGLVSSRKAGLQSASGDYILYIDGDDWIELDLIECYLSSAEANDADIIVSSHIINLEGREEAISNTLPIGVYDKQRLISEVYPKMMYTGKFSQFGIFSYAWGKLYRRTILLENQLNVREDITMGEDALCVYPTLLDSNKLVILNQPLYHYRQRADSLIKTLRSTEISKMQSVYDDLKQIYLQKGVLDTVLNQLQYYLLSLLMINTEGPDIYTTTQLYPFLDVNINEKLVIYGGGTFGQHIFKKISQHNNHEVVAWVDERHYHYSKLNLPVVSLDIVESVKYDKIIIALIDENNSNRAVSELLRRGVDISNIIQVSHYRNQNIQQHLLEYKINL
jgi:glycosyltransferase involved in cell wall biosynthesis